MKSISLSFAVAAITWMVAVSTQAGNLTFNTIDNFESQAPGSQPDEFHDSDTGWDGEVTVVASPTDGVSAGAFGGSQFAKVVRDGTSGPFAHVGASQEYPAISASAYGFLVDIYTQSAPGASGQVVWINGVNDVDLVGNGDTVVLGDIVMTEAGFNFTPGETSWSAIARGTAGTPFDLAADTWYTFEVIFDGSDTTVQAIHNIYPQGGHGGAPLYSVLSTPDDDRFTGNQGAPSADLGGPRYTWFTNWNANTVGALYVDNIGTHAVPEPATLALAGLAALGLVGFARRRK